MKTTTRAALAASSVVCALVAQAAPPPVLPNAAPSAVGLSPERLNRLEHYVAGEAAARHKAGPVVLIARRSRVPT